MAEASERSNVNNEVEELEELLVGLDTPASVDAYSEDDDEVTLSMAAPLGERDWMVQYSPLNRKMISADRLLAELESGTLSETTLVWRGGMDDWVPIAEVAELARGRRISKPPSLEGLPAPSRPDLATPLVPPPPGPLPPAPIAVAHPDEESALEADAPDEDAAQALPPPALAPRLAVKAPVAAEFSPVPPRAPLSMRSVLFAGAVAVLPALIALLSLARGGVFETAGPPPSEGLATNALQPGAATPALTPAARAPSAVAAPAPAPAEPMSAAPVAEPAPATGTAAPAPAAAPDTDDAPPTSTSSDAESAEQGSKPTRGVASARAKLKRKNNNASRSKERAPSKDETPAAATAAATAAAAAPATSAPEAGVAPARSAAATAAAGAGNFDRAAAQVALEAAAVQAGNCRPPGGPTGSGRVQVRYEPSGKVAAVSFSTPGFVNTTAGDCVQMVFRRARVKPYNGGPVVLSESFEIK